MNLLPEFRKSSKLAGSKSALFGTVDCTINTQLCESFNIRSFPTTILYNNSIPNLYHGQHNAQDISEFIEVKCFIFYLNFNYFKMIFRIY